MNKNEWMEGGKKNRVRMQEENNDPSGSERKKAFLIVKLTSGQFPEHELNSQSIKQAERKWQLLYAATPSLEISRG